MLCLGTWQFGDPVGLYKKQAAETEAAIVRAAVDAGINFIDTAEGYGAGESERAVAAALKAAGVKREDVVIASKVNPNHLEPTELRAALDRSLTNLDTTYLDLYQIHWPKREDWDIKATFECLKELQDEKKIRAVAVSNHGPLDLEAALATGVRIATNQLPWSLSWRPIEVAITDKCKEADVGILAYSPLGQGLLTGKYEKTEDCPPGLSRSRLFHHSRSEKTRHDEEGCEDELWKLVAELKKASEETGKPMAQLALSWVLSRPGVTSVIFGASKPEHVGRNTPAALETVDEAILKRLTEASEGIKTHIGKNCDLWDTAEGGRYR